MLLPVILRNQWVLPVLVAWFLSSNPLCADEVAGQTITPVLPETSNQAVAPLTVPAAENTLPTSVDFLMPDSPLSTIPAVPESTLPEFSKEADFFEDLTFHPRVVSRGKIQLSQHESITFETQKITAESFGNQIELNLRDQNLTSQTFAGYVLGPFNPRNDYMNVYDDTLGSVEKLIEQAIEREEKNPKTSSELAASLKQAHETVFEFQRRTRMLKAKADEEQASLKLLEALRDHYQGELPDYEEVKFESDQDARGQEIQKVVLRLPWNEKDPAEVSERVISLKLVKEDFQIVEVVDRGAKNQVIVQERYDYDAGRQLRKIQAKAFYLDGKLRTDREERFDNGIRQSRYREEFSPGGQKTRLVREIFYENGILKSTADFDYLKGQKHSYLFSSDGQALSSNIEPIHSSIQ